MERGDAVPDTGSLDRLSLILEKKLIRMADDGLAMMEKGAFVIFWYSLGRAYDF